MQKILIVLITEMSPTNILPLVLPFPIHARQSTYWHSDKIKKKKV